MSCTFRHVNDEGTDATEEALGDNSEPYYSAVADSSISTTLTESELSKSQGRLPTSKTTSSMISRSESRRKQQPKDKDSAEIASEVQKFFDYNEDRLLRFPLPPSVSDSVADTANNNNNSLMRTTPSALDMQQQVPGIGGPSSTPPRRRRQQDQAPSGDSKLVKSPSFDAGPFVRSFVDASAAEGEAGVQQQTYRYVWSDVQRSGGWLGLHGIP